MYHTSQEARQKRCKTLTTANCTCGQKADITWMGEAYCFKCFQKRRDYEKRQISIGNRNGFVSFVYSLIGSHGV